MTGFEKGDGFTHNGVILPRGCCHVYEDRKRIYNCRMTGRIMDARIAFKILIYQIDICTERGNRSFVVYNTIGLLLLHSSGRMVDKASAMAKCFYLTSRLVPML